MLNFSSYKKNLKVYNLNKNEINNNLRFSFFPAIGNELFNARKKRDETREWYCCAPTSGI